jgi:hypothetical protein
MPALVHGSGGHESSKGIWAPKLRTTKQDYMGPLLCALVINFLCRGLKSGPRSPHTSELYINSSLKKFVNSIFIFLISNRFHGAWPTGSLSILKHMHLQICPLKRQKFDRCTGVGKLTAEVRYLSSKNRDSSQC